MKKLIFTGFLACMMACSTTRVSYDYDKSTDFSKYQTYSYSEDAVNLPIQQLNRDRMIRAIDEEMTARGFTKSDDPDVLVDLHVKAEKKTGCYRNHQLRWHVWHAMALWIWWRV